MDGSTCQTFTMDRPGAQRDQQGALQVMADGPDAEVTVFERAFSGQ